MSTAEDKENQKLELKGEKAKESMELEENNKHRLLFKKC